ncbi:hypothetical protein EUGRSUZ_L01242 [Eucalyptus grandis]|uniref:Serine-threonine/tyrosine-protein kinase catalytic domain-containing protein n=1 Tax=Eucalyptus grandis TaxID=71139 RepID=A0A058ZVR5_EUCGR|nr:hypothetical protein EUGRSUZ_L01242 [Eucalyptus grandis]
MIEDPLGIMSSCGRIPDELRYLVERELIAFVVERNNLTRGIPNWSGNGSSLVNLESQQNNLRGRIPTELGSISRLEFLHIGFNKLTGRIPSSIYNLTSLLSLAVNRNNLHGEIPLEIGNYFPHLQFLFLGENRFSGQVPHSLPNATRLGELYLEFNSFTESVPTNIGNLMDLTKISFSVNQLQTGLDGLSFLTALTNCTKLKYLDFGYNKLRGEIPASIACISGEIPHGIRKLQNLTYLYLWGNSISGAIPSSLGIITQLLRLSLRYNQLEGDILLSLGRCRQLQALALSNNNLNGTIPKEVIGLSCLSLHFGVAGNSLIGPLPLEVGNMSQIVQVDLSHNRLTGEIPSTLFQCPMLNLEGEVPQEGIFRDMKCISIMRNKELCGGIKELGLPACKVHDKKKRRKLPKLKISIAVTISFLIMLTCFVAILYGRRKSTMRPSLALPTNERFPKVSYAKLCQATNEILDGNRLVTVKVLNLNQKGAFKSFLAECETLRNVRHQNLVNIIIVCSLINFKGAEFKALVYDLMGNGSLEWWLHPSENPLDMPKLNLN